MPNTPPPHPAIDPLCRDCKYHCAPPPGESYGMCYNRNHPELAGRFTYPLKPLCQYGTTRSTSH